jgi:hypothetical protein
MQPRWIGAFLAYVIFSNGVVAWAQTASSLVSGQVICVDGNTAARHAAVEFVPLSKVLPGMAAEQGVGDTQGTETDFNGTYEVALAPGTYVVNAFLPGYANDLKLLRSMLKNYGLDEQKKLVSALPQLTVKAGANSKLDLSLRRAGSISGRVSVDVGGVLESMGVTATLVLDKQAVPTSTDRRAPSAYTVTASTDDRGGYRIFGLPAGNYHISLTCDEGSYRFAGMRDGVSTIEPSRAGVAKLIVYASEALVPDEAQTVHLEDGDEARGIDITVPLRLLHSIGGKVSVNGAPAGGVQLALHKPDGTVQPTNAISMPDGSYRFDLLPQGNYTIEARAKGVSAEANKAPHGTVPVALLDTDVLDANIDLRAAE